MSATVGGNVRNSGEIDYGLGSLRVEITLIDCLLGHGITCKKLGFEKISFRSESISWDMTIYTQACTQLFGIIGVKHLNFFSL